jgi:hypothetical protein
MHPGLVLPWRGLGLGPFDHELADGTIEILSRPFEAQHEPHAGVQCCYVCLDGRRQLMPVESIRRGVLWSHTMRDAQAMVTRRPAHVSEEQAQYSALYQAMEAVWVIFEVAYGDGDPAREQARRRAFSRDFGNPS